MGHCAQAWERDFFWRNKFHLRLMGVKRNLAKKGNKIE